MINCGISINRLQSSLGSGGGVVPFAVVGRTSGDGLTVAIPEGSSEGSTVVVILSGSASANFDIPAGSDGSGWTQRAEVLTGGTGRAYIGLFVKTFADAAPPSQVTFARVAGTFVNADQYYCYAFNGVDAATPIPHVETNAFNTGNANPHPVTPFTSDAPSLFRIAANTVGWGNSPNVTAPSGMTRVSNRNSVQLNNGGALLTVAEQAEIGPGTYGGQFTPPAGYFFANVNFAVKPA